MVTSCEKKIKEDEEEEEHTISNSSSTTTNSKIDAQILIEIAESNLKVVAISQKAQEGKMENNTRTAFKKVESDHIELKNEIKKIAKNNFIIIPNTLFDTNLLKSFISEANTYLYLKKTEKLLLAELDHYQTIAKTSLNNDLKTLATDNISNIQKNIASIQYEQKQEEK